jgi:hypothetical protein
VLLVYAQVVALLESRWPHLCCPEPLLAPGPAPGPTEGEGGGHAATAVAALARLGAKLVAAAKVRRCPLEEEEEEEELGFTIALAPFTIS